MLLFQSSARQTHHEVLPPYSQLYLVTAVPTFALPKLTPPAHPVMAVTSLTIKFVLSHCLFVLCQKKSCLKALPPPISCKYIASRHISPMYLSKTGAWWHHPLLLPLITSSLLLLLNSCYWNLHICFSSTCANLCSVPDAGAAPPPSAGAYRNGGSQEEIG